MRVHSFSAAIALALPLALASAAHTAPISFMELHGTIAIDITTQTFGQSSGAAGASGHIDLDLTGDSLTVLGSHIDVGDITATGSGLFGTLLIDDVHTFLTSTLRRPIRAEACSTWLAGS